MKGGLDEYKCKCCGHKFIARVADRNRGWARFCDKSCAAKFKDKKTGGVNREHYGT